MTMPRSEIMSRIKAVSAKETISKPLAEQLAGCRLRHQPKGIYGRPDFANKRRKVAVFMHGCFWHGHSHVRIPKTNSYWWALKMKYNKARHRKVVRTLRSQGWKVVTFWECHPKMKMLVRESRRRSRPAKSGASSDC